jgi:hypothetical protein
MMALEGFWVYPKKVTRMFGLHLQVYTEKVERAVELRVQWENGRMGNT